MEKFDVIIPAGGRLDDHFARVALTPYKPLIKVQDYMVGFRSLEAVQESGRLGRVIVIGPKDVQDVFKMRATAVMNETGEITKNIAMGIRELKSMGDMTSRVLIITADLPYVEAKTLTQFLDLCPNDADLVAPLISKEEYVDRFPGATGTFAKLNDGDWTLGCAYLVNPEVFQRILPEVEKVVANRKNIFKMSQLLGFGFLWKVITKSISVPEIITKLESILGCKIKVVRKGPADLAYDIDDIVDYEYALRNK